jgi:hypothetical protein
MWRNPMKEMILPLAVGALGFLGATILLKKTPSTLTSKMNVAGFDLAPIAIPLVAAFGLMFLSKKVGFLAKNQKVVAGLAFGLGLAGAVAGVGAILNKTGIGPKLGLSGYTVHPMAGYVRRPFSGYVTRAGMGQLEDRRIRTLGDAVKYQGAMPPHGAMVPMERAVAYSPAAVKPYGLGLPIEERRYNEFDFGGVYSNANYEN